MVCGCFGSMFTIRVDDNTLIDIPGSFSPRSVRAQLFKCSCLAMTIAAAVLFIRKVYGVKRRQVDDGEGEEEEEDEQQEQDEEQILMAMQYVYYLAYFTVWGLLASALYFVSTWANSCFPLIQTTEVATLRLKYTWVLFEVAAHTELTVTILYWGLLWQPTMGYGGIGNLLAHGGVMILILWTGLVVNRVPVRLVHFIFPFAIDILYLIWTFCHDYFSLGNGLVDQDDDAIYSIIDWGDEFLRTATLAALVLCVVSPSVWILLWLLSLCGRRYIKFSIVSDNNNTGNSQDNYFGSLAYANAQVGRRRPQPPPRPRTWCGLWDS